MQKNSVFFVLLFICIPFWMVFLPINARGSQVNVTITAEPQAASEPDGEKFSQNDPTEPLIFWQSEIGRVESTPLNLVINGNGTYNAQGTVLGYYNVSYEVPNWVGQVNPTFRMVASILVPPKASPSDQFPGFLLMHGLYGNRWQSFADGVILAKAGCVILLPDHPGHGDSEGAKPVAENFYFHDDYNRSAHCYLTLCGAIQSIRLLQNWSDVDSTRLGSGGFSYGGLNTMYLGGVYGNHLNLTMPMLITGDLQNNAPESLVFNIFECPKDQVDPAFWAGPAHYFDPLYYLDKTSYPEMFWGVGTHDEFFDYGGINTTYDVIIKNTVLHQQIHPNGHHGLSKYQTSMLYMVRYKFYGEAAPPTINGVLFSKASSIWGDTLTVAAQIHSDIPVGIVEVAYRYKDIFGDPWHRLEMALDSADQSPDQVDTAWSAVVPRPWRSSEVEYVVIVTLPGEDGPWFTSTIYTAGVVVNKMSWLSYLGIILAIGLPALAIVHSGYQKEFLENKNRTENSSPVTEIAEKKKRFFFEIFRVIIAEIMIFAGFFMSWIGFPGVKGWTMGYFLNLYFTWTWLVGGLAFWAIQLWIACNVFSGLVGLSNPKRGGKLFLIWPVMVLLGCVVIRFWLKLNVIPGIGIFLQIAVSLGLIWLGRNKQKRLANKI